MRQLTSMASQRAQLSKQKLLLVKVHWKETGKLEKTCQAIRWFLDVSCLGFMYFEVPS